LLTKTHLKARFALSSSATFTRSDLVTDSERFYNSILLLLEDPDESEEVNDLFVWWNRFVVYAVDLLFPRADMFCTSQVFPTSSSAQRPITKGSALAKIREKRAALKARNGA